MIFEQEEKLRRAYKYSCPMKLKQTICRELPITIKLIMFMWVLRNFVSFGAKYLLVFFKFAINRY